MKFLICGGYGFIGSAFIRKHLSENPSDEIINIDNLTLGSNKSNLDSDVLSTYQFINSSITDTKLVDKLSKDVDIIINFAAETHVDRSISNPLPFIKTNVLGTYSLLEASRKNEKLFIHVSTDEVYGDSESNSFKESANLNPSNPYSATKASADLLVNAYVRTYKNNCIITRCTNNFGPFQFPEKLIPKTIIRAQKNLKIPLYGNGEQIRSWIYVNDHVDAIQKLCLSGIPGEIYNITAWNEISNKNLVKKILNLMNKSEELIEFVPDRPGHDKRYSIDSTKIQKNLNWKPKHDFDNSLQETISWYLSNSSIWEPLINEQTLHPQPWTINWN